MTNPKTILVWGSADILSSSIELFLAAKEGWQVVSIADPENLEALTLALENTRPDIVILSQGCPNDPARLPLQLFQGYPVVKLITVNLENNTMEVYSRQKIMVEQASDLISLIENDPYPKGVISPAGEE